MPKLCIKDRALVVCDRALIVGECAALGACCASRGCGIATPEECQALAGTFMGVGTTCPDSCIGACCTNGACTQELPGPCALYGGDFQGYGVPCSSGLCGVPPPPCCGSGGTCHVEAGTRVLTLSGSITINISYCCPPLGGGTGTRKTFTFAQPISASATFDVFAGPSQCSQQFSVSTNNARFDYQTGCPALGTALGKIDGSAVLRADGSWTIQMSNSPTCETGASSVTGFGCTGGTASLSCSGDFAGNGSCSDSLTRYTYSGSLTASMGRYPCNFARSAAAREVLVPGLDFDAIGGVEAAIKSERAKRRAAKPGGCSGCGGMLTGGGATL